MAGNSIGTLFRVTTFGESHGPMVGAVIDGCPAGLMIDLDFIQSRLDRRKPGQSRLTTQRKESDRAEIVSGVFEGRTTGTPLTALIRNEDSRSKDYDAMAEKFRPSHADYTYFAKYGLRDHRGGGRSSARETAARVFAGAIAESLLRTAGVEIHAYVSQVGEVVCAKDYRELDFSLTDQGESTSLVRCPDEATAKRMVELIENVRRSGDSVGGVITGIVRGCPVGLGEPVFDRLHADLGKAMLSINAVKGFEIGSGFQGAAMKGSEHNDPFAMVDGRIVTTSNHSGGVQGGISNGMDIYFRVAFKPVATIMKKQKTVDLSGREAEIEGRGRHDPCVLPRAVAIVEAMTAITLADHYLRARDARV